MKRIFLVLETFFTRSLLIGWAFFFVGCTESDSSPSVAPFAKSQEVYSGVTDCAIWIHPTDPTKSLLVGSDCQHDGSIFLWNLDGRVVSKVEGLPMPTNVDIRQNVRMGEKSLDIVACGMRGTNQLSVFTIDLANRTLVDITAESGILVGYFEDARGFCLYHDSKGKLFAFISSNKKSYIHQFELAMNAQGRIQGRLVRELGIADKKTVLNGLLTDDSLGFLYCYDKQLGILKYEASPEKGDHLLQNFGKEKQLEAFSGFTLYKDSPSTGYLVLEDSYSHLFKIYNRAGKNELVKTIRRTPSQEIDGMAATSYPVPPTLHGFVVCHSVKENNFLLYDWDEIMNRKEGGF